MPEKIVFLVSRPGLLIENVFITAINQEFAKSYAAYIFGGAPDQYTVTPVTNPGACTVFLYEDGMIKYTEPSNEQLANFLVIYARQIPQLQNLELDVVVLELQLQNPVFREAALKHYRGIVQEINAIFEKMERSQLPCEHIRSNGKKCPNYNEPGSFYCGLHKEEETSV